MNPANAQLLLAFTCVAVAVAVLIRRAVRLVRNPDGGCHSGGCNTCPSKNDASPAGFVPLDQLTKQDVHSN
jgi:hypothetical protein